MAQRNVFICHHSNDDEHIQSMKDLLETKGYTLKNSSIDNTKPNQANDENYIKNILRSRIKWASTMVVLIGKQTAERDWVDWEIEQANSQGKRIIGVYIQGGTDSDVPKSFEKYGNDLRGWQSDKIIDAIEGRCNSFQRPDGTERTHSPAYPSNRETC